MAGNATQCATRCIHIYLYVYNTPPSSLSLSPSRALVRCDIHGIMGVSSYKKANCSPFKTSNPRWQRDTLIFIIFLKQKRSRRLFCFENIHIHCTRRLPAFVYATIHCYSGTWFSFFFVAHVWSRNVGE